MKNSFPLNKSYCDQFVCHVNHNLTCTDSISQVTVRNGCSLSVKDFEPSENQANFRGRRRNSWVDVRFDTRRQKHQEISELKQRILDKKVKFTLAILHTESTSTGRRLLISFRLSHYQAKYPVKIRFFQSSGLVLLSRIPDNSELFGLVGGSTTFKEPWS